MNTIVVFDLETTGLSKDKDFIIQFAGIKIDTATNSIIDSKNMYIQPSGNYTISIAAYLKHGITPEFLNDKPKFADVADEILEFLNGSDILTYNGISFDIPFLKTELERIGKGDLIDFTKLNCYDAFLEEKRRNGNKLEETYARYKGKTMEEAGLTAHDALSDVKATYSVFYAQQLKKQYGPEEMFGEDNVITKYKYGNDDVPCFAIGKYHGVPISYVVEHDMSYINWCLGDTCNFSKSTKKFIESFVK